ncbi:unnamed protein product [Calicophoron daubneyi]|uniref:Origin recognition complex subunit 4 n=1 Tax=Calicophoron daubneyi TaxID=300641 RepID=A0AAV2TT04_CALDB
MELLIQSLRHRFFHANCDPLFFEDELKRLKHTIHSLVVDGIGGSLLIIGRRGVGKRRLLSQALNEVKKNPTVEENLMEVHLDGLIHTDDRAALRAMAKQLHREALLDESFSESGKNDTNKPRFLPFSQQLTWFLEGLHAGDKSSKSLLIVLHEFDLFALHRNQILLYNLFDCCQQSGTPVCVIGVTCRLILVLTSLDAEKTHIEPVEFIDALCSLREDAKLNSLKGLSILELFLVAALVKLQEINDGQTVNFEILYSEYAKFCRTNCPNYLYDKPVVFKSLDNLIDLELVTSGKEAVAVAAASGTGRGGNAGVATLPHYKPLYCFVNADVLSSCLDAYPNCPVELQFWIHSRTF